MTLSVEEFNQHAAAHVPGAGRDAGRVGDGDTAQEVGRDADSAAAKNPAVDLLMLCAPIPSWCDAVIARAPYASAQELVTVASELTESWTPAEVFAALADHPRIGEKATGVSAQAAASRREQSGLSADQQAQQQWIDANAEYEQRFGCIFLIRAAGRTSEQMMEQLQQRLRHDSGVENQVRRDQLAQIALLRLADGLNITPPVF